MDEGGLLVMRQEDCCEDWPTLHR